MSRQQEEQAVEAFRSQISGITESFETTNRSSKELNEVLGTLRGMPEDKRNRPPAETLRALMNALISARETHLSQQELIRNLGDSFESFVHARQGGAMLPGTKVVARTDPVPGQSSEWILCSIVADQGGGNFIVKDEDPGDKFEPNPEKKEWILPRNKIIPLVPPAAQYPAGTPVLAMWPESSTFYRAKVHLCPSMVRGGGCYEVFFEDDREDKVEVSRSVDRQFIVLDPAGE